MMSFYEIIIMCVFFGIWFLVLIAKRKLSVFLLLQLLFFIVAFLYVAGASQARLVLQPYVPIVLVFLGLVQLVPGAIFVLLMKDQGYAGDIREEEGQA